jgi:hypothetical protein
VLLPDLSKATGFGLLVCVGMAVNGLVLELLRLCGFASTEFRDMTSCWYLEPPWYMIEFPVPKSRTQLTGTAWTSLATSSNSSTNTRLHVRIPTSGLHRNNYINCVEEPDIEYNHKNGNKWEIPNRSFRQLKNLHTKNVITQTRKNSHTQNSFTLPSKCRKYSFSRIFIILNLSAVRSGFSSSVYVCRFFSWRKDRFGISH